MKIDRVHCFFEQSGTFKHEFIKLGIPAKDYDIRNDFNETDYMVDLFEEINRGYEEEDSIFDCVSVNDLILAFFPCVRFSANALLHFRCDSLHEKKMSTKEKLLNCMKYQKELTTMYNLINKLIITCIDRNLRLIIENPYKTEHYLTRYWCLKPAIIDMNRRLRGDYYKKPTQYWFINCNPSNNTILEPMKNNAIEGIDIIRRMTPETVNHFKSLGIVANKQVLASMIHPDYANRFIREYIL